MLGSLVGRTHWCWTLWGKHPAEGDFLCRGLTTRVEQAIATWIENGYSRFTTEKSNIHRPCAWRFWTKADGNHRIACGIISDSGDRLGRPFPLLVMGTGKLAEWEPHWEYLPMGLARMWRRMEALSASRAERYEELQKALCQIEPPEINWPSVIKNNDMSMLPETDRLFLNEMTQAEHSSGDGYQIVTLGEEPILDAMHWHRKIKARARNIPTALFMGGAVESPHMAVFHRALSPSDFVHLWKLSASV